MNENLNKPLQCFPKPATFRRAGVTLAEILVIVAVISILVALLFPAFKKMQQLAQQGKCLSNMRSIGAGVLAVAAEQGRLPAMGHSAKTQQPTWGMKVALSLGIDTTQYGQKTVFICPADRTWFTAQGQNMHNNHIGHSSYAANINLMDWEEGVSALDGPAFGGVTLGSIARPSRTILIVEVHEQSNVISWSDYGGKTWQKGWTFEYTRPGESEEEDPGKKGYHNGRNHWLFADGHIELLKFSETISPDNLWKNEKN